MWEFIEDTIKTPRHGWKANYRCGDCGKIKEVLKANVQSGKSSHCGCTMRKMLVRFSTTHGMANTREYNIWGLMKKRCDDLSDPRYGGKGIIVCARWKESMVGFQNFIDDMGPCPPDKDSIDRLDPNGNYETGKCRWANKKQQMRNMTTNRFEEFLGLRVTVADWADIAGIKYGTLSTRLQNGWSMEEALFTQPQKKSKYKIPSKMTIMFRIALAKKGYFQPK